jgi:hypothetical protein
MSEPLQTQTRSALAALIETLQEIDARYLSPDNRIATPEDVASGHRAMMHLIGAGLDMYFDADADHPEFRRAHWAGRKFYGDNADCVYFNAVIRSDRSYRIRGNMLDASYVSFASEGSSIDDRYPPERMIHSLHNKAMDIAPDGGFEIIASVEPQPGNWLKLEPGAGGIATRHYFERDTPVAHDPSLVIPLSIEPLGTPAPPRRPADADIARDILRLKTFMRAMTLDTMARTTPPPPFVSMVPNQFNPPGDDWDKPQSYGASDIVAMMAPYFLAPDQALIVEGRFPKCAFASVALWNRFMQTYDYQNFQVSLNRKQTKLESDGSFRMIVAHEDTGVPNWINTVGAPFGMIYVRFALPEEAPQPLVTKVVALASLDG